MAQKAFGLSLISKKQFVLVFLITLFWTGCSSSPSDQKPSSPDQVKTGKVVVQSGELQIDVQNVESDRIMLYGFGYVPVVQLGEKKYIPIEGIMDASSFSMWHAQSDHLTEQALSRTIKIISSKVNLVQTKQVSEIGYFKSFVEIDKFNQLKEIKSLPTNIIINPVVLNESSSERIQSDVAELSSMGAEGDGLSGLKVIGAVKFAEQVKSELGVVPNGSQVKVGIADTGITLNHPTFDGESGKTRIIYMKDFTGEGRVFINPKSKFEVSAYSQEEVGADPSLGKKLMVKAEVLPPGSGLNTFPSSDKFTAMETEITVSSNLKTKLISASSGARMGTILESSFSAKGEPVDLNRNGSHEDSFPLIVLPTGDGYEVYVDFTGKMNFEKVKPIGDWNQTKQSVKVFAERIGFDISTGTLKSSLGEEESVLTISIVGLDPGGHGTHVTGIIAGKKTFINQDQESLARGAAPGAQLMVNRVCANNGGCNGTEAVIDLAMSGAEIINMSLGGVSPFNDGYGVQETAINRISLLKNTLFVISAGNSGPGHNTVGSPSTATMALSIGATATPGMIQDQYLWPTGSKPGVVDELGQAESDRDFMLFFSSRGPNGAGGFQPSITAPGSQFSSVPLNPATGVRGGNNVYWGTSMAAPSAAGGLALLLDAIKIFNSQNSENKLATDVQTLRRIIIESARSFDTHKFDPQTGAYSTGKYTWIDQGVGMIDLPAAWAALKAEAESRIDSEVTRSIQVGSEVVEESVPLGYQVRVFDSYRNGRVYDGTIAPPEEASDIGRLYGKGICLKSGFLKALYQVQIARRIPVSYQGEADYGELFRQLVTSYDKFELKTVYYGSNSEWLKVGTQTRPDCLNSPLLPLRVNGQGALDGNSNEEPVSLVRDSVLNVCVDRSKTLALPPGDHGALIHAYRVKDGQKESTASFIVPVYMNVPHKVLAGNEGYEIDSSVKSFEVSRHYISIPKGTSLVKIRMEVPKALVDNGLVQGCSGTKLYIYEASNSTLPKELAGEESIARSCKVTGELEEDEKHVVELTRNHPEAGVWDVHVFGRYAFALSHYNLSVSFATLKTSVTEIKGDLSELNGDFQVEVTDGNINALPIEDTSKYLLNQFIHEVDAEVANETATMVKNIEGKVARSYGDDIISVKIDTYGSEGNDIDLVLVECSDEELSQDCSMIGQSGTPTDVEEVVFEPKLDKFYAVQVLGFEINDDEGKFKVSEAQSLKKSDSGSLEVRGVDIFTINYSFDQSSSAMIQSELFQSGKYSLGGSIQLSNATNNSLVVIPVTISKTLN